MTVASCFFFRWATMWATSIDKGVRMRRTAVLIVVALSCLVAREASAQLEFRLFETDDMLVVYMDEDNEYILPHLTNCFTNSFDFHKKLFDYTPSEPVTVLLQDFDDYGYAGASAMPTNYLTIGIEPFEYVYETSPTNERINWVMSHELLHIVASDKPAPTDQRWRRFFSGKVSPLPEEPLSMVYSYLTTPQHVRAALVPRGHGGVHGDLDGGRLRTRARRLRRDGLPHDGPRRTRTSTTPSGSSPRARPSTSRSARSPTSTALGSSRYLADHYGPESVIKWIDRSPDSRASYRAQFEQVYGDDLDSRVEAVDRVGARVAAGQHRGHPRVPGDRVRTVVGAAARLGVARLLRPRAQGADHRRQLPGRVRPHRHDRRRHLEDDDDRRDRHPGALLRHLAGLRPRVADRVLHHRQQPPVAGHQRRRPGNRQGHRAGKESPHRRSGVRPEGPLAVGRAAQQRAVDAGPARRTPIAVGTTSDRFSPCPSARTFSTSTSRPTAPG